MKKTSLLMLLAGFMALSACKKDDEPPKGQPDDALFSVTKNGDSEIGTISLSYFPWPLTDMQGPSTLAIVNGSGEVLKRKEVSNTTSNLRKWAIGAKTYYSYTRHNPDHYRIPNTGYINGDVVIADENLNEIKTVQLLPHNGRTANDPVSLGGHDFILLGENHYIVQTYYQQAVTNVPDTLNPYPGIEVVDNIIQEVKDGQVVFEWRATDDSLNYLGHYALEEFSDSSVIVDFAHFNSMFIDPADDNLICSFRSLDQVMKINRTTGEIMWRLGGKYSDFALTPDQVFLRQHNATYLSDGSLLLFDNGDLDLRAYSRVCEFKLDEVNKTVTSFSSQDLPENTFAQYMGSVDKKNGHYIIGCGSVGKVFETDATTGEVILKLASDRVSYRALHSSN